MQQSMKASERRSLASTMAPWLASVTLLLPLVSNAQAPSLDSAMQKLSYGIGLRFGAELRQQVMRQGLEDIDADALLIGIRDSLTEMGPRLSPDEMRAALEEIRAAKKVVRDALAAANLKKGEEFMARNRAEQGVVTMDNGIQYRVLTEGKGVKPGSGAKVKVHYIGRLLNGEEFDSSRQRDTPVEFSLDQVIAGWGHVVQQMPTGSLWEVWIPAEFAYGEQGAGASIGPNETLHFDIELIEILATK